jgi:hypothetical protein
VGYEKPPRYSVVRRACSVNDPAWAVYVEQTGRNADVLAHFFTQEAAESYCALRNRKEQ